MIYKMKNVNNQELLDDILVNCCSIISTSIIVRKECIHSVDNVIFENTRRVFVDNCKNYLVNFFCENTECNVALCRNLFLEILKLFQSYTYISSRAYLDEKRIKSVIVYNLKRWFVNSEF